MEETVKTGVRAEHAALTRTRILDAARAQFERRGFAGTPITGIARSAGVAVPTVYKIFTSKRNLLAQVVERAMTGAEYGGRVDEQEWWQNSSTSRTRNEAGADRPQRPPNLRASRSGPGGRPRGGRARSRHRPDLAAGDATARHPSRADRRDTDLRAEHRARFSASETALTLQALTAPELYTGKPKQGEHPPSTNTG